MSGMLLLRRERFLDNVSPLKGGQLLQGQTFLLTQSPDLCPDTKSPDLCLNVAHLVSPSNLSVDQ